MIDNKKKDFLDILLVLAKNKMVMIKIVLSTTIIALIVSLVWPKTYRSSSEVIQTRESVGGLGSLLQNFGSISPGQNKIGGETILVILNSKSLKTKIIDEFNLVDVYGTDIKENLLQILSGVITVEAKREGGFGFNPIVSVKIFVEDESPSRAKKINDFIITELINSIEEINNKTASEGLEILQIRVDQNLLDLTTAEKELNQFQNQYGIIELDSQVELMIETLAELKAKIIEKEIELNFASSNFNENSSSFLTLQQEKEIIEEKYYELVQKSNEVTPEADGFYALGELPDLALRYYQLRREVEIQNKIYQILIPQLEQQKLYLRNEGSGIRIVDFPETPTYKHSPKRAYIVIAAFLFSVFLGLLIIFIRDWYLNGDKEFKNRIDDLGRAITKV